MRDVFTDALNSPAGRLAEVLLKKLTKGRGVSEIPEDIRTRFDELVDAPGKPGKLARIRLAAEVSYLFERAPEWTKKRILPLFDWSSPDAADAWDSRKYSNYIGSPELFDLMKKFFLDMFGRSDVGSEDLRIFAEWLAAILIANRSRTTDLYPLSGTEARAALRRAGAEVLPSVGHRLAMAMEAAKPGEKVERWRTIVGPVFQAIWPLDVELQSGASTFTLAQILRATGEAFPEAADIIIPFIRPDEPRSHSTIYSISEAPDALYASSPAKMLEFIAAVVGEASPGSVFALGKALSRVRTFNPDLANTRKFQNLLSYAAAYIRAVSLVSDSAGIPDEGERWGVDSLLIRGRRSMARAYSQDLRDRVLGATAEGWSARGAAERFEIGIKTAIEWVRRARETNETAARRQGQPKGSKLDKHEMFLLSLVAEAQDMTLAEIQARPFAERCADIAGPLQPEAADQNRG